jgi:murein DD-endopeptidase MepM/ murein hydrolase activator NlpD
MTRQHLFITLAALALLLAACGTQYPETCPSSTPIGLKNASEIAGDDSLPFRFPLDESPIDDQLYFGWFGVSNECPPGKLDCYVYPEVEFHAAEDYKRPAGTPVYAMADGIIRFSGPAMGYGWLILIDHPEPNLYSLYGHLSPSRWEQEDGTRVARGDLIGYLGDSYENGGSVEQPVETHLHFGIRAGQTTDYPGVGEWRFHGGWLRLCPQDVGWLQPSRIITQQEIPAGGFEAPRTGLIIRWELEILVTGLYIIGGGVMLLTSSREQRNRLLLIQGAVAIAAGIVLHYRGLLSSYILAILGALILAAGIYLLIRNAVLGRHSR